MGNEYRAGPVYRAGLIVSGGMCAGLGIAILASSAFHRAAYDRLLPVGVSTPPAAALGFAACGLALIGIGFWFPRVTSVLAMVTMSMAVVLAAERVFDLGPRVETLIAANLRSGRLEQRRAQHGGRAVAWRRGIVPAPHAPVVRKAA